MSLKSQIINDGKYLTSMTDEMAVSAIYTKYSDSSTVLVSLILDAEKYNKIENEGRTALDRAIGVISLDFTPSVYDTLTIESETFKIMDYQKSISGYTLSLERDNRPTNHHTKGRFR